MRRILVNEFGGETDDSYAIYFVAGESNYIVTDNSGLAWTSISEEFATPDGLSDEDLLTAEANLAEARRIVASGIGLPATVMGEAARRLAIEWVWAAEDDFDGDDIIPPYRGWRITYDYVPGNLWSDDPADHGVDEKASLARYAQLCREALEEAYPGATVTVRAAEAIACKVRVSIPGTDDRDFERDQRQEHEAESADNICERIWEKGAWYVELHYGAKEFAAALGLGTNASPKFGVYRGRGLIPAPAFEVASGPIWTHSQVAEFKAQRNERETAKTAGWTIDIVAGYVTLWTDDPKNHGLDEAASARRYVGLARAAVRAEYPRAKVAASYASDTDARSVVKARAAGLTADEECARTDIERDVQERVEEIAEEVREAGRWYVRLAEAAPVEDYPYEVRRPWLPATHPERWQQAYTISRHQTYDAAIRAPHSARQREAVCGRDKDGTWRPMSAEGPSRPEPPRAEIEE